MLRKLIKSLRTSLSHVAIQSNDRIRELYNIRTIQNPTEGNRTKFNVFLCLGMLTILTSVILSIEFNYQMGSRIDIQTFAITRHVTGIFMLLLFLLIDGSPESLGLGLFLGFESIARAIDYELIVTPYPLAIQHTFFQMGDIMRLYFITQLCRVAPKNPISWISIGLCLSIPYGVAFEILRPDSNHALNWMRSFRDVFIGLTGFWMCSRVAVAISKDRLPWRMLSLTIAAISCLDAPVKFFTDALIYQGETPQLLSVAFSTFSVFTYYLFPLSSLINISNIENRVKALVNAHSIEAIRKAREEEQINSAIAKTTQMLAHDIRKPFSLIRAYLEMLSNTKETDEVRILVNKIVPEVSKALMVADKMTHDIMDIGHTNLSERKSISPVTLIRTSLDTVYKVSKNSQTTFQYDLKHRGAFIVDDIKISRVISNLIENAEQAIAGKSEVIKFNTYNDASNGSPQIKLIIHNSGTHISEEDMPHIFEAFFTKGKKNGTGLGLAIVKRIVQDHGGSVYAESHPTDGTAFILSLPANFTSQKDSYDLPPSASIIRNQFTGSSSKNMSRFKSMSEFTNASQKPTKDPIRVFVVDDEPGYAESIVSQLLTHMKDAIYSRVFSDPSIAMNSIKSERANMVISDFDLRSPTLDGFDVLRTAKEADYNTMTVLLTNHIIDDSMKMRASGYVDIFLPKPLTIKNVTEFSERIQKTRESHATASTEILTTKIIVIEDDMTFCEAFERLVKKDDLVLFTNPQEFFDACTKQNLNLNLIKAVITDLHFADHPETGHDVGKFIRSQHSQVNLILFTNDVTANTTASSDFDYIINKDIKAALNAASTTISRRTAI